MKEEAIKKINKIGHVSSVFALIGKIVVGMGLFFVLVGAIMCFAIPESLVKLDLGTAIDVTVDMESIGENISEEDVKKLEKDIQSDSDGDMLVTIEDNKLNISDIESEIVITMRDLAWLLMMICLSMIMTMVTLCFVSSLCKAFKNCESPFEENVIIKMRNFAYSLIPWALISTITESVGNSFANSKPSITLSVDLGMILVVLVVFVLVHIFKYGAVLQQESDETL